jgi:hypothetical protein
MRSTDVAEWILSQVTTGERAEAVIGDLLEKVPTRGALWFWWSVVTTAAALVWREVAANPLRTFGLGFTGFVLVLVLFVLLVFVATAALVLGFLAFASILDAQRVVGGTQLVTRGWGRVGLSVASWCVLAGVQFQVGRWLARRSPGHELAPCVAFTIVGLMCSLALILAFPQHTRDPIRDAASAALLVVLDLPLYAGAVNVRKKLLERSGLRGGFDK